MSVYRIVRWSIACIFLVITSAPNSAQLSYISPAEWSPDGSQLAVVSDDIVEIWDVETQEIIHRLVGHTASTSMLAWHPTDRTLATASFDLTIKIWNADDGSLLSTLIGHDTVITTIEWSPDGMQLLSWGLETQPSLYVWNVDTGEILARYVGGGATDAQFSPDGQILAVTTQLSITTLDAVTLEIISRTTFLCCGNQMFSVKWSPDGNQLATGSMNGIVTIWDSDSLQIVTQFIANTDYQSDSRDIDDLDASWVRGLAFDPTGTMVLSASGNGEVRMWDVTSQTLIDEVSIDPMTTAAWSPLTARLASVDLTSQIGEVETTVLVPFATLERFEMIANACNVPSNTIEALTNQIQDNISSIQPDQTFSDAAVEISPVCERDLRILVSKIRGN